MFDIIVLSETKIDDGFPDSQFYINGYKMLRNDRNHHGGGLLVYVRRELTMCRLRDYECKNIESITFSIQQRKTAKKTIVIASYRPPSLVKSVWVRDLGDILLRTSNRYENIVVVGDLNCDLAGLDKNSKEGRALQDLMEIYNLTCQA